MSFIYGKVLIGKSGTNLQRKHQNITKSLIFKGANMYYSLEYFVIGVLTLPEQLTL